MTMKSNLQLWKKTEEGQEILRGEIGHLYSLDLKLPMKTTMTIIIIVKSDEARQDHCLLQYSVLDMSHSNKVSE